MTIKVDMGRGQFLTLLKIPVLIVLISIGDCSKDESGVSKRLIIVKIILTNWNT